MPLEVVVKCEKIILKEFKEVYMKEREVMRTVFSDGERYTVVIEDYYEKGCFMLLKRLDGSEYKNYDYTPYNSNIHCDNK